MTESETSSLPEKKVVDSPSPLAPPTPKKTGWSRFLTVLFIGSLLLNLFLIYGLSKYCWGSSGLKEVLYEKGDSTRKKIALIEVRGVIAGNLTDRILKTIEKVKEDKNVDGVVLVIDSPGGLVADSHEIYDRLKALSKEKPMFVSMRRMAASGGYYIAMGAGEEGTIFVEPTTWTGSIGVILPRYDLSQLAEKFGVKSEPITTGEFKDALNPFKEMSNGEKELWKVILDDSFKRFVSVISENRKTLDEEAVRKLATGQIYTANQALKNGLVDERGYLDDAIEALQEKLGGTKRTVVRYQSPQTLADRLLGSVQSSDPRSEWRDLLELTVPKAMYFCSWGLGAPLN